MRGGVGLENQQLTQPSDFVRDLHRFGNEVEHQLVPRLALGGNKQQMNCRVILWPDMRDAFKDAFALAQRKKTGKPPIN